MRPPGSAPSSPAPATTPRNPSASGRAAGTREHHCWTGHIIRAAPAPGREPGLDDMDVATREDGTALRRSYSIGIVGPVNRAHGM